MDSPSDCPLATTLPDQQTIGVSIIANVYTLDAPLVPIAFLILQVVQLVVGLVIIFLLYICLILDLPRVHQDLLL
jgi:phage shock protein PspC (stress-responsive transcriptional regulator)